MLVLSHNSPKTTRGQGRSVKMQSGLKACWKEIRCPWSEIPHLRKDPAFCFPKGSWAGWDRCRLAWCRSSALFPRSRPLLLCSPATSPHLHRPFLLCFIPCSGSTSSGGSTALACLGCAAVLQGFRRLLRGTSSVPAWHMWYLTSQQLGNQRVQWLSLSASPCTAKCMRIVQGRNYCSVVMEE